MKAIDTIKQTEIEKGIDRVHAYNYQTRYHEAEVSITFTPAELEIVQEAMSRLTRTWSTETAGMPETLTFASDRLLTLLNSRIDFAMEEISPKPAPEEEEVPADGPPPALEVLGLAEGEEEVESRG